MSLWHWTTPYTLPAHSCLSPNHAPSQGIVYALTPTTVLKLPIQYLPPTTPDAQLLDRYETTHQSLAAFATESALYDLLAHHPHPNLTRRLHAAPHALFLERLTPLAAAAVARADQPTRRRWVTELCSAVAHLEALGYIHGDLAPRNVGTDGDHALKLFDFGSAVHVAEDGYDAMRRSEHSGPASCIHFILSGADPLDGIGSVGELRERRRDLVEGRGVVEPEARVLGDVIQECWMGRRAGMTFAALEEEVGRVLGVGDGGEGGVVRQSSEGDEEECREWLRRAEVNPEWKSMEEYCAEWRRLGLLPEE